MNDTIIAVSINGVSAELEIAQDKIKCLTGKTIHFEQLIPKPII